jgi:molybdate/tungstate transport system substrate-binding protein
VIVLAGTVGGCGSPTNASTPTAPDRGPVQVLYAGSLVRIMEHEIAPAFTKATGIAFSGFGAGSSELAHEIKGGIRAGDVFVSASPQVDASLEGTANGGWVSWEANFARAPLVLAYQRHSRFATQLRTMAWEHVVTQTGFLLGRTDPVLDPKGRLTAEALEQAAQRKRDPKLLELLRDPSTVFPEETLLGRLEAGQLDAGFFYTHEAKDSGLATVALTPVSLSATFTVTVLERAPHRAAAIAFVSYLLGASGRRLLAADGLQIASPARVTGSGVPSALRPVLAGP